MHFSDGKAEVEHLFPEAVKSVLAQQSDPRCSILLFSEAAGALQSLMNVCCVKVSRFLYIHRILVKEFDTVMISYS